MSLLSPLARVPDFVCTDRPASRHGIYASTSEVCGDSASSPNGRHVCAAARKGEECRDESQTSCVMVVASALSGIDVNRERAVRMNSWRAARRATVRPALSPALPLWARAPCGPIMRGTWSPLHSGWSATVIVLRIVFVLCGLMLSTINDRQSRLDTLSCWLECSYGPTNKNTQNIININVSKTRNFGHESTNKRNRLHTRYS